MWPTTTVNLTGERFQVTYRVAGDSDTARERAEAICVEQTVEFPADLLPPGDIPGQIVGQIERFEAIAGNDAFRAVISYPVEISDFELPQLLNVVFGNSSIKPGIRVDSFALPEPLLEAFRGPRFGQPGWRARLGVFGRPLLCTALKPMGLDVEALAELAYQFALGGIDIIKDDHGLADQPFAPFEERVGRCVEAVARANAETGGNSVYMPNVSARSDRLMDRAFCARQEGAGALMIAPGLVGWDTMRALADDDSIGLPIMCHPALLGSFVTNPEAGISHSALFGQLVRLAGADATIYPNYGGRFSFSQEECQEIVAASSKPWGDLKPIFPTPGGGMSLERVPELDGLYGDDVIFLIGGNLHRHGPDRAATARRFLKLVTEKSAA